MKDRLIRHSYRLSSQSLIFLYCTSKRKRKIQDDLRDDPRPLESNIILKLVTPCLNRQNLRPEEGTSEEIVVMV
jgi:hypothetical protein